MGFKTDLAIVNRSFWPQSQVIGEGLLQFAECMAETHSVCLITQSPGDLAADLYAAQRGSGLNVCACRARTNSSSSVLSRIFEAVGFMFWVGFSLVRARPAKVYVSSDPPVIVPWLVAIYCKLFRAQMVYHLQDIHPEAANIVLPLNPKLLFFLRALDNFSLRQATKIITLSTTMREYIESRSATLSPIILLDNPAIDAVTAQERSQDIIYCGNAGRLQRIPLLMAAIRHYVAAGGTLQFTFVGGGIYADDLSELAESCDQVSYLGVLPASDAAALVGRHRWALLPIDDEVTRYAFPSKSSSYALAGSRVLAICGAHTSVAKWVNEHRLGLVCEPVIASVVNAFFYIQQGKDDSVLLTDEMADALSISYFANRLKELLS